MFYLAVSGSTHLAALAPSDAEALFALISANRAHLRAWVPWVDDTLTLADTLRFIAGGQRQAQDGQALYAGLWHEGELAGVLALNYIDRWRRQTEIGYWLGAAYQGRGLMTAACRALVDYAFTELALNRVEIRCSAENHRSRAVPQRLKFVEEGAQPQFEWLHGRYIEMIVYAMNPATWSQVNSALPAAGSGSL